MAELAGIGAGPPKVVPFVQSPTKRGSPLFDPRLVRILSLPVSKGLYPDVGHPVHGLKAAEAASTLVRWNPHPKHLVPVVAARLAGT